MVMDERAGRAVAQRAAPYDRAVVPATDAHEHPDEREEAAVQRYWQPICERHGAAMLGIRDVPRYPVLAKLEDVLWELAPLGTAERAVPAEVFHRWRALEAAGVPFQYWLWGEEQPQRPNFRPLPTTSVPAPTTRRDPL